MQLFIIPKIDQVEYPAYSTRLRQWPRGFTIKVHLYNGITEFIDDDEKCNLLISTVRGEWHNQLGADAEKVMTKWHRLGVLRRTAKGAFYMHHTLYYQVELYIAMLSPKIVHADITQEEVNWLVGLINKKPEDRTLEEEIMNACTYPNFPPFGTQSLPVMHLAPNGQVDIDCAVLNLVAKGYLCITDPTPFGNRPMVRTVPGKAAQILHHEAVHRETTTKANSLSKIAASLE